MASDKGPESESEAEARRMRLASALRENLKRRKAQQRGREAAAELNAGSTARLRDNHKI